MSGRRLVSRWRLIRIPGQAVASASSRGVIIRDRRKFVTRTGPGPGRPPGLSGDSDGHSSRPPRHFLCDDTGALHLLGESRRSVPGGDGEGIERGCGRPPGPSQSFCSISQPQRPWPLRARAFSVFVRPPWYCRSSLLLCSYLALAG